MSWTKRQLVNKAFSEIGIASYDFDLSPEMLQGALDDLDAMMGEWEAKGIAMSYPLPATPSASDLDTDSLAPDKATAAIYLNLAMRIASGYGKTLSVRTAANARSAYITLLSTYNTPTNRDLPDTMPRGAGNKPWANTQDPFIS